MQRTTLCDKKFQLIGMRLCDNAMTLRHWHSDTGLLPGKKSAQNYIEELWERKSPARQAIYFNFSSIYSAKLHFYRVKYCIVTWSFWLFTSVLQTVIPTSIVILKVFRELNKLQFNFVATSLRQFWTELFAKNIWTFWPLVTLTLGQDNWKWNGLVRGWCPIIP